MMLEQRVEVAYNNAAIPPLKKMLRDLHLVFE